MHRDHSPSYKNKHKFESVILRFTCYNLVIDCSNPNVCNPLRGDFGFMARGAGQYHKGCKSGTIGGRESRAPISSCDIYDFAISGSHNSYSTLENRLLNITESALQIEAFYTPIKKTYIFNFKTFLNSLATV